MKGMTNMYENIFREIEARQLKVHGLEIFYDGKVHHRNFSVEQRFPIYSATKSFVSTAVGIASDEKKLSVDTPLCELLTQKALHYIPSGQLAGFRKLPVSRFLTMSVSGYSFRPEGEDWLADSLSQPVDYSLPPTFSYSNIPAYLVGVACENAVGEHLMQYLMPRLFEPLGICRPKYRNCPGGHFYGASGMELSVHELGLLGRLYLENGIYEAHRLLSENWVQRATSLQIMNPSGGYGYFFWMTDGGFSISGKWGQKCLVYPQKHLVVTYLSDLPERADEMQQLTEQVANA
jgi:CubicO group peptidase (beta-lactamase class C family)